MSPSVALSLTLSIQLKALTRGWRRQNREFQEKSRHVSIRKVTVLMSSMTVVTRGYLVLIESPASGQSRLERTEDNTRRDT